MAQIFVQTSQISIQKRVHRELFNGVKWHDQNGVPIEEKIENLLLFGLKTGSKMDR